MEKVRILTVQKNTWQNLAFIFDKNLHKTKIDGISVNLIEGIYNKKGIYMLSQA